MQRKNKLCEHETNTVCWTKYIRKFPYIHIFNVSVDSSRGRRADAGTDKYYAVVGMCIAFCRFIVSGILQCSNSILTLTCVSSGYSGRRIRWWMCVCAAGKQPCLLTLYDYFLFDFNNQRRASCSVINRCPDTFAEHSVDIHRRSYEC